MADTAHHDGMAAADSKDVGYQVFMPPERYIPVSVMDVVDAVRAQTTSDERNSFSEICSLVEGCAVTEFTGMRRRVKKNFALFSAAARHKDLVTRKGRAFKKDSVLDEMEMTFLQDFMTLMGIAHFQALTQADWVGARQERLMLQMPLTIGWDDLDSKMLSRYFEQHPEADEDLFKFKDRALVFHRGVGVIRKKDMFLEQKVDLLVKYLVAYPSKQVFYKLAPYLGQSMKGKADAMQARDEELESVPPTKANQGDLNHRAAKHIRRISLRALLPTYKDIFANVFTKLEIVEPTYKNVVTLYRRTIQPPLKKELQEDPTLAVKYRRDRRGIHVHRFDEIPIADLEIVLPNKEIGIKLIDKLTLAGTAAATVVGGLWAFFGGDVELGVVMSVMSGMAGKLFQTYSQMQAKKAQLVKEMAEKVHEITVASQEGALFSILDEMADQYVKEMLVAYFTLLKHRTPATQAKLDELCETWLEEYFGVKIDFDIEESLPRLINDGLIKRIEPENEGDPVHLTAVSLEEAHERLIEKWKRAFVTDNDDSDIMTMSMRAKSSMAPLSSATNFATGAFNKVFSVRMTSPPPEAKAKSSNEESHTNGSHKAASQGSDAHEEDGSKSSKLKSFFHKKKNKKH